MTRLAARVLLCTSATTYEIILVEELEALLEIVILCLGQLLLDDNVTEELLVAELLELTEPVDELEET